MRKFTDAELELAPKVAEIISTHVIASMKGSTMRMRPTIEDCLEWLRERGLCGWHFIPRLPDEIELTVKGWGDEKHTVWGKSTLETIYRCIIEVRRVGGE